VDWRLIIRPTSQNLDVYRGSVPHTYLPGCDRIGTEVGFSNGIAEEP
jgi:hypothetical protein